MSILSFTITAVDHGDRFMDCEDTNTLSASSGTISLTATGAFSNGVWSGALRVTAASPSVTLHTAAQLQLSKTGTSNSFAVVQSQP